MALEENSVMSSLQELYAEQERRRADQVRAAHCRKLEQEREALQQQARESDAARRRSEDEIRLANQRRVDEEAEQVRLELARIGELERAKAATELHARIAAQQREQQYELSRLAILRDQRLTRLEGQRGLLGALLTTLVLGSTGLYWGVIRPGAHGQEELIATLTRTNSIERLAHEQELGRLIVRLGERDASVAELGRQLEATRRKLETRDESKPVRGGRAPRPALPAARPAERPCVDDNDPLCGNLKKR